MDFKCLKDCMNKSFLFKSRNALKSKDLYMNIKWLSLYIYTITTSFPKTLIDMLSLLEVITYMLLGRLQINAFIYKDKIMLWLMLLQF